MPRPPKLVSGESRQSSRIRHVRGFDVHFAFTSEFCPESGVPAVIGGKLGSVGHFIAILEREGEKFVVTRCGVVNCCRVKPCYSTTFSLIPTCETRIGNQK